jgi:hypothetical protein
VVFFIRQVDEEKDDKDKMKDDKENVKYHVRKSGTEATNKVQGKKGAVEYAVTTPQKRKPNSVFKIANGFRQFGIDFIKIQEEMLLGFRNILSGMGERRRS